MLNTLYIDDKIWILLYGAKSILNIWIFLKIAAKLAKFTWPWRPFWPCHGQKNTGGMTNLGSVSSRQKMGQTCGVWAFWRKKHLKYLKKTVWGALNHHPHSQTRVILSSIDLTFFCMYFKQLQDIFLWSLFDNNVFWGPCGNTKMFQNFPISPK